MYHRYRLKYVLKMYHKIALAKYTTTYFCINTIKFSISPLIYRLTILIVERTLKCFRQCTSTVKFPASTTFSEGNYKTAPPHIGSCIERNSVSMSYVPTDSDDHGDCERSESKKTVERYITKSMDNFKATCQIKHYSSII